MKKVLTSCLVVLICLTAFITGYCKGCYSYAEEVSYMTDEELEAGINAYIEAKGGSMLGTVGARMAYAEGKLYNFLTSSDNATPIKTIEDLKSGLSWNRQAIEGMDSKEALMLSVTPTANSFLASYLVWLRQQHYFGDNVTENENGMFNDGIDNNVYSGILYNDAFVYVVTNVSSVWVNKSSRIIAEGTAYKYSADELNNATSVTFPEFELTYNIYTIVRGGNWPEYNGTAITDNWSSAINGDAINGWSSLDGGFDYIDGKFIIYKFPDYDSLYFGKYSERYTRNNPSSNHAVAIKRLKELTAQEKEDAQNVNINFYTNNNNNITVFPSIDADGTLYITPKVNVGVNGEVNYQPYIFNEGDTITNVVNNYYTDSGTKDKTITVPSDNPDVGDGGSNDNPSGGTPPDWSNNFPHLSPDGEGGFNFNFTLPDLNIDWNINGLSEKFPFSIPFDLIHFVQVLNAEPETPEFDWTIDLKIYQWHIDADLHQFDNLAGIVRNVEFIGFCITLVMITRRMIKG